MPRIAGMPMGQGVPKKTEPATHTIYSDGTYSNEKTVVGSPVKAEHPLVELGELVVFGGPYAKHGYVYQITDDGFWTRPEADHAPDVSKCNFWSWSYVEQHLKRKG